MARTKQKKAETIKKYQRHSKDVGSPEVQIALLTDEILNLANHLKKNPKDLNSKRGLILKVVHRRKLLKYLERKSYESYIKIKKELKL